jgi:hypothetical protein
MDMGNGKKDQPVILDLSNRLQPRKSFTKTVAKVESRMSFTMEEETAAIEAISFGMTHPKEIPSKDYSAAVIIMHTNESRLILAQMLCSVVPLLAFATVIRIYMHLPILSEWKSKEKN